MHSKQALIPDPTVAQAEIVRPQLGIAHRVLQERRGRSTYCTSPILGEVKKWYENGDVYEGEFKDETPHGHGYPEGSRVVELPLGRLTVTT